MKSVWERTQRSLHRKIISPVKKYHRKGIKGRGTGKRVRRRVGK